MLLRRGSSLLRAAAPVVNRGAAASVASAVGGSTRVSVAAQVRSLQRSAAYLRHAPPSLYVTMDLPGATTYDGDEVQPMRHSTRLLDSAGPLTSKSTSTTAATLQTHGVYLLTSTSIDDVRFENGKSLRSVLIGLPRVHSAEEAKAFVSAHAEHLQHLKAVLLPEISHSGAGHAVRALLAEWPTLTFAGSPFSKAFLSDPTFFDGVRRTVLSNELVRAEAMAFAELPPAAFQLAEDEVPVAAASFGARRVTAYWAQDVHREERLRRTRRHHPGHFYNQPIYYHDTALDALHVGGALCRLPWLPNIVTEVGRDTVLPAAPMLAAQRAAEGAAHPLLSTWRPTEAAESLVRTVQRVPTVQHLLAESFGEATTADAEGVALATADTAAQLDVLRSRFAVRLETDTARNVDKWRRLVLEKIVDEVLAINTANQPTDPPTRTAFTEWALEAGNPLGTLATALTQAAIALPPSTVPEPVRDAAARVDSASSGKKAQQPSGEERGELEGANGVALMQDLLSRKGLSGLNGVVKREEIDVAVFLAMTPDDFRRVFKATFGVSKRLELLQAELRAKL